MFILLVGRVHNMVVERKLTTSVEVEKEKDRGEEKGKMKDGEELRKRNG